MKSYIAEIKLLMLLVVALLFVNLFSVQLLAKDQKQETDNNTATEKEVKKRIIVFEYSTELIEKGREEENSYYLGLAAVIYFMPGGDSEYGRQLLDEATKIAKRNNDSKALRWLVEIWAGSEVGPNDIDKANECKNKAELIDRNRSRGTNDDGSKFEENPKSVFPQEYLDR